MNNQEYHVAVLKDECLSALKVKRRGLYLDGTLGGGGHSGAILEAGGNLIAVDRDMDAIDYVTAKFALKSDYLNRYTLVKDNFKNVASVLKNLDVTALDGAILDLGVSSHQLDEGERGFSYMNNGMLDMRMDREQFVSAMSIVNDYTEEQLSRIIYTYGEDRFARVIARNIVKHRAKERIETTEALSDIIKRSVPFSKNGHPAKKTFQAIRIEVNNELSGLGEAIESIAEFLKPEGRLCVITFHSLEDRIVKQVFRNMSQDCICDKSLPVCVCRHKATVKMLKKVKPTSVEEQNNPRSKSATLRIIEKL